jgi:hypothetical protein
MKTEGLFALNDRLQNSALILAVMAFLPAVEVISVDYEQVEAEEVKAVVLVFFRGGKGTSPTEDSPAAQNIMIIHWQGSKSSTRSRESGPDDT